MAKPLRGLTDGCRHTAGTPLLPSSVHTCLKIFFSFHQSVRPVAIQSSSCIKFGIGQKQQQNFFSPFLQDLTFSILYSGLPLPLVLHLSNTLKCFMDTSHSMQLAALWESPILYKNTILCFCNRLLVIKCVKIQLNQPCSTYSQVSAKGLNKNAFLEKHYGTRTRLK